MSDKTMIPVSDEHVAALQQHLQGAGKGLFDSPLAFINLYNSGIINKSNEEVKETARRIVETYKNLREQYNEIVFLSEAEVALQEIRESLEPWHIVAPLKRIVEDLVNEDVISLQSDIALSGSEDVGYLLEAKTVTDPDTGQRSLELSKVSREKLFTRYEQLDPIFRNDEKILTEAYETNDVWVFTVEEILSLDDSFTVQIQELLG